MRKLIILLVLVSAVVVGRADAVTASQSPHDGSNNVVCSDCHSCKNPTQDNPCLLPCPRPRATPKGLKQGPDVVTLYELEYEYKPVVFEHKLHAEMSPLGGHECSTCHHFAEGGTIASCKNCHPAQKGDDLLQPGLKGAYHRQCLKCHEEWSGETNCEMCHAKKAVPGHPTAEEQQAVVPETPRRLFGVMEEPETKVWQSNYGGGTVVTLHHHNHTDKYGIECASCHHAEGCGSCHQRKGESVQRVRHSEEALHAICNQCHEEMSCDQCHLKAEAPAFSHDRTGWPLGKRHGKLACRMCHGDPHHFTKPDPNCNSCHSGWNESNFDHARTGLALNEIHSEFECTNCHVGRAFDAPPTCSECHDKDISFPDNVPGSYTGKKK